MKKLLLITLCAFSIKVSAQNKQDVSSIKAMCGCYRVSFNFAETFSPDSAYTFHANYQAEALEWVTLAEEDKKKLSLQHLLIVNKSMVIKHWRQDWLYENEALYEYEKDKTWKKVKLTPKQAKGTWTQKVYQVDDGPRYEGVASWVHLNNKDYWENTTDAPLPRREYTKRHDYNVMGRKTRHEIIENGWIHEQDNAKILREDNNDTVLAYEKGMNYYTKVDDQKCSAAKEYWDKNQEYWALVRATWNDIYEKQDVLKLKTKVENEFLYQRLFDLASDYKSENKEASKKAILEAITPFIIQAEPLAQQ